MPRFRLYWLRETGCDAGTPLDASELEPTIAERVMKLAREGDNEIPLHLPFLDKREWRRRAEVLSPLDWVREGEAIRCVLDASEATRDRAATLALTDEVWKSSPSERDPLYFKTWQTVSLRLQKALRAWIPEMYFRDIERYEDRDGAYPLVVYAAAKPCYGRPRTEFTFDVADPATLASACRTMGRAMQTVLAPIEKRLWEAGKPELSRRYAPVWQQDILAAVRKRPKRLVGLLADEAMLINAVIELGTERSVDAVNRLSKAANAALRNVCGEDMRGLGVRLLDEATAALGDLQSPCLRGRVQPAVTYMSQRSLLAYGRGSEVVPEPRGSASGPTRPQLSPHAIDRAAHVL